MVTPPNINNRSFVRPALTRIGVGLLSAGFLVTIGGCQKTALRAKDDRSQFDRYDQARNQRAEPYSEDEYGKRTPNLRGRLIVRDD
ncbi:MAG: hypothetical protein KC996_03835 [Phycisphaerales bacterium]|nr:hypothetical protein [Phycisphaerales bacterium]